MSKPPKKRVKPRPTKAVVALKPTSADFDEVIGLIQAARSRTFSAVNKELIDLYWQVGEYISRKLASSAWGESVVQQLADYIGRRHPELRGFTRRNLFRMRQFYDTYKADVKVSPLVTQLPWTHNLMILSRSKHTEEREFYLRMAVQERWTKRELERQLNGALFERVVLSPVIVSPLVRQLHPDASSIFKDTYLLDFLDLPASHSEDDLQKGLVEQLRRFLIELGRDFCFVGSRYQLQVGGKDFFVDLLFYHRWLSCLVAFELKIEEFEPNDLGQLQFYVEALDRDVKKPHEQPSIGVLLCATKNQEVVEYALSRTVSPALVAEYQSHLPDKRLLQAKLHEFYELAQQQAARAIEVKPAAKPRRARAK